VTAVSGRFKTPGGCRREDIGDQAKAVQWLYQRIVSSAAGTRREATSFN
jgi:hypothetical protein